MMIALIIVFIKKRDKNGTLQHIIVDPFITELKTTIISIQRLLALKGHCMNKNLKYIWYECQLGDANILHMNSILNDWELFKFNNNKNISSFTSSPSQTQLIIMYLQGMIVLMTLGNIGHTHYAVFNYHFYS